jgi:hypothetical protein
LRPPDAEVFLGLPLALTSIYDEAAYDRRADYTIPAEPRLSASQAKWAEQILREKNLLPST